MKCGFCFKNPMKNICNINGGFLYAKFKNVPYVQGSREMMHVVTSEMNWASINDVF